MGKPVDLEADGTVIWEDEQTGERWTEGLPPTPDEAVEILALARASGPPDARADSYAQVFSDTWNANLTVGLRPMVIAWIEGGIGYTAVVRGEVDVLEWDWDNIKEAEEPEIIEAYIEEAQRLPDDWPEKADILANMDEYLVNLKAALDD